MTEEQNETVETTEDQDLDYEVVKDAKIDRYFDFELQVDDEGFFYNPSEDVLGAVVQFQSFPAHETLNDIFDDLLVKAVICTQEVDPQEAQEMIEDCEDPSEYSEELDVAEDFSVFFTVEGYRGLYRLRILYGDTHVSWSNGRRDQRWEV